ncbi:sensor histidine kinase [Dactylosporangium siamense]|uniref:Signal transduction histidine kinase subgroup 3 dimerisation and phosphoacceptor domain-containing protein n=1 Tax=Dactylosporangium siamense TaxID=685454 RepID=A0A919U9M0_9ACTN|nr:histidine kinase [Dactylosporangium siamense]GIG47037.1 hypothetical protein Dsi01nite_050780 [Dactylosporangium siamense]
MNATAARVLWAPASTIGGTGLLAVAALGALWYAPAAPGRVWAVIWQLVAGIGFASAGCVVTALDRSSRPGRWMVLAAAAMFAVVLLHAAGRPHLADGVWVAAVLVVVPSALLAVIDPKPSPRLMRVLGRTMLAAGTVSAVAVTAGATRTALLAATAAAALLLGEGWILFELTSGDQRRQLLWLILGLTVAVAGGALLAVALNDAGSLTLAVVMAVLSLSLPLTVAVASVDPRVVDVREVIHRSAVLTVTLATVAAGYEGGEATVETITGAPAGRGVRLVLALAVATSFHPLMRWVRTSMDEMLFGGRADPIGALGQLGTHLAAGSTPTQWLETLRAALAVPGVVLRQGDEVIAAAGHLGPRAGVVTALTADTEHVGDLVVALPGELTRLPATTTAALDLVAGPLAQLLRANRLAEQLRTSRGQVVHALEDDRRRMRRDLHDGLGPTLTGIVYNADAAANLLHAEPDQAEKILRQLRCDATDAITEIRRIVYGMRPAALDELGLVNAVRQQIAHLRNADGDALRVDVTTPRPLPALPAAAEVAAYRVIVEAVTNVARHAGVTTAAVDLRVLAGPLLRITVDDGGEPRRPWVSGVGLTTMRERVEHLGGVLQIHIGPSGTTVVADIPFVPGERL